ncbi:thioredoxin family protein [Tenacibaculum dicentrarchi]|uniref:thioredoxin family protein n=1 Tax=Tenacibaculum dicentrarchi TaxID=669041 RepID=UPI0035111F4E
MKKIILTFVLLISISQHAKATTWMTSFEDAKKLSIATNKLILIDFWATWCYPCQKMEADTWRTPEIESLLSAYIPLKIDIDVFRKISNKYSANRIPYVLIVDAYGEVFFNETGYKTKEQMLKVLKKYAINTKVFQNDFASFYKKQTPEIALSLGKKYLDASIYLKGKIKYDFLKLGGIYFKKIKKLTSKKEYKQKYSQKVNLLAGAYKLLIKGKNEKALKYLDKNFKEVEILPENKVLFDFIGFTAYNKLKDKENAKIWYEKLKTDKGYKTYLSKSRKI